MDAVLNEVQKILRQVEEELTPIIAQGISASITIHCGHDQSVIEVNRKMTIRRKPARAPEQSR